MLQVGGFQVEEDHAARIVSDYVHPQPGVISGFPYYDHFETSADPQTIVEADLLAPNILNAPVRLREFAALNEVKDRLTELLTAIPSHADLADAHESDLEALASVFGVLDELRGTGVGAVKFTKVLHRKRPAFIPIMDINVLWCYQHQPSEPESRVPPMRKRSWSAFAPLLATAMRDDLTAGGDTWESLARLAEPALSTLRALDIVAWRVGNHPASPTDADE